AAIFFRLAVDADQFLSIAKLRALRLLWARVEEGCGLTPQPVFVSATTAWRMLTQRDPWVNLLRATVAVFSAGLGGADAVTVLPFTAALGLPDRFARRGARAQRVLGSRTATRGGSGAPPSSSCSKRRSSPRPRTRPPAPARWATSP